jgi:putative ABC transport system ATP-binding protein
MAVLQTLNDQGKTIIIVTHEHDISQYTKRIVEMRDGRIIHDFPVTNRRDIREDLQALSAGKAAKVS